MVDMTSNQTIRARRVIGRSHDALSTKGLDNLCHAYIVGSHQHHINTGYLAGILDYMLDHRLTENIH
jgi:hypothetical protein